MEREIVVQLWDGLRVVGRLRADAPDPSPAQLDAIARAWLIEHDREQDGVKPNVRVMATRMVRT